MWLDMCWYITVTTDCVTCDDSHVHMSCSYVMLIRHVHMSQWLQIVCIQMPHISMNHIPMNRMWMSDISAQVFVPFVTIATFRVINTLCVDDIYEVHVFMKYMWQDIVVTCHWLTWHTYLIHMRPIQQYATTMSSTKDAKGDTMSHIVCHECVINTLCVITHSWRKRRPNITISTHCVSWVSYRCHVTQIKGVMSHMSTEHAHTYKWNILLTHVNYVAHVNETCSHV